MLPASPPPVQVVPASAIRPTSPAAPVEYLRPPYAIATALAVESDVPITTPDAAEGARRGLGVREGLQAGIVEVGPGGGEDWHRHLSYYDIVIYVVTGEGVIGWEEEGRVEEAAFGPGDVIVIRPGARNWWRNAGAQPLRLFWVAHYHNSPAVTE
ncbi:MAG: hypothetical protein KatS3mg061_0959 [Dehalococcoidia bacterium]|nr:MAG: hypothetical protein KatS3mg061_0959 [Dehalococcoidia bacterium]